MSGWAQDTRNRPDGAVVGRRGPSPPHPEEPAPPQGPGLSAV